MSLRAPLAFVVMTALGMVGMSATSAHAATQNVTASNTSAITINDAAAASPYPSTIHINAQPTDVITDVNITLHGLSHTFAADLDVLLVAPDGTTNAVLLADAGAGSDFSNATITFDDQASAKVQAVNPIPSGSYQPTAPGVAGNPAPAPSPGIASLSAFNGMSPDGNWQLYVSDDLAGDAGAIVDGWSLDITSSDQPLSGGGLVSSSDNSGITINDAGAATPYPAQINVVAPTDARITDVNVTLSGLTHTFAADLDVVLVGPDGSTNATLLADTGAGNDYANADITFDDQAGSGIPSVNPIPTGSYRPTAPGVVNTPPPGVAPGPAALGNFDQMDPNGTWSLYIQDDLAGDAGSVTAWSLDITYADPAVLNTALPVVTGVLQANRTLHVSTGSWTPAGVSLAYQWLADGTPIAGATDPDYTLTPGDIGKNVTVRVTASKSGYVSDTEEVGPGGSVAACAFTAVSKPSVSGAAAVGTTLTANSGGWDPDPSGTAYQWYADGTAIPGATGSTFTPSPAEIGKQLTVKVTASLAGCADKTAESAPTSAVVTGTFDSQAPPQISGDLVVGSQLTVSAGTWSPTPSTTSYQWVRGGAPIAGATGSTYTTTAADEGEHLAVVVTVTRAGYEDGQATATAAGAIGESTGSNLTPPTVTGSPVGGSTLTASEGTWSFTPDDVSYQWYAGGQAVDGETGSTLVLDDPALVGEVVTVRATASRAGFADVSAMSDSVGPVTKAPVTITPAFSTRKPYVGDAVTLTVTVAGPASLPTTGHVRVLVGGRLMDGGDINSAGSIRLTIGAFHEPGRKKVVIRYGGTTLLANAVLKTHIHVKP